MTYIAADDSLDIKHGFVTESPDRGTTARYVCNPIVDDIERPPDPKEEYQPPCRLVTGDPPINDLASWRWQGRTVDAETERELIRCIQEGDPQCRAGSPRGCGCRSCRAFYDPKPNTVSLLPAFHHSIRKIAGSYVPNGSARRKHKRESESLIFQDLMAAGCFGLWKSALAFDFDKSCRLWTFAQPKIEGWISREANYQRRRGQGGGSRIDRWIFDHLSATPEELLEAQNKLRLKRPVFHSLQEAADALKRANNLEHSEVYLDDGQDGSGDIQETAATEPLEEFRDLYDSGNPLKWSPQLSLHRDKVSPIVDFWIDEFCYPPRVKSKPNRSQSTSHARSSRLAAYCIQSTSRIGWSHATNGQKRLRASSTIQIDVRLL